MTDIISNIEKIKIPDSVLERPKKYHKWIIKQLESGAIEADILSSVDYFHEYTHKFENKDLYQYKTVKELEDLIKQIESNKTAGDKRKEARDGAVYLGEDDEYKLYRIDTKEASILYGKNTKWCITMQDADYFYSYSLNNEYKFFFALRKVEKNDNDLNKIAICYIVKYNRFDFYNQKDKTIKFKLSKELQELIDTDNKINPQSYVIKLCKEQNYNALAKIGNSYTIIRKVQQNIIDSESFYKFYDYIKKSEINDHKLNLSFTKFIKSQDVLKFDFNSKYMGLNFIGKTINRFINKEKIEYIFKTYLDSYYKNKDNRRYDIVHVRDLFLYKKIAKNNDLIEYACDLYKNNIKIINNIIITASRTSKNPDIIVNHYQKINDINKMDLLSFLHENELIEILNKCNFSNNTFLYKILKNISNNEILHRYVQSDDINILRIISKNVDSTDSSKMLDKLKLIEDKEVFENIIGKLPIDQEQYNYFFKSKHILEAKNIIDIACKSNNYQILCDVLNNVKTINKEDIKYLQYYLYYSSYKIPDQIKQNICKKTIELWNFEPNNYYFYSIVKLLCLEQVIEIYNKLPAENHKKEELIHPKSLSISNIITLLNKNNDIIYNFIINNKLLIYHVVRQHPLKNDIRKKLLNKISKFDDEELSLINTFKLYTSINTTYDFKETIVKNYYSSLKEELRVLAARYAVETNNNKYILILKKDYSIKVRNTVAKYSNNKRLLNKYLKTDSSEEVRATAKERLDGLSK